LILSNPRYIAVEGPIGVGKTSFAKLLAEELDARTVLEEVDENPFLGEFYDNRRGKAFQVQMFFLLSRYRQQNMEFIQFDLFSKGVVADYLWAKDRIFAYQNLDDNEIKIYDELYRLLSRNIPRPDLVIYLQASTETLVERIKKRGRGIEKKISPDYVNSINEAYNKFFFHYGDTPLLIVQTTDIDYIKNPDALKDMIKAIGRVGGGTLHYRPIQVEE
jgi:deoxyadenosine/deoxycytidine kinase